VTIRRGLAPAQPGLSPGRRSRGAMSIAGWTTLFLALLFGAALSGCPPHKPTPIAQRLVASPATLPAYGAPPAANE
jgi:hypothetical protein